MIVLAGPGANHAMEDWVVCPVCVVSGVLIQPEVFDDRCDHPDLFHLLIRKVFDYLLTQPFPRSGI